MVNSYYAALRRWLAKTTVVEQYRKIKSLRTLPKYSVSEGGHKLGSQKSIVFLCPSTNVPIGGVKVIYKQAAILNKMDGRLAATVLHPFNPKFGCTWFDHGATIKKDLKLDRRNDFVMIPEFWAVPHARLLHNIGIRYGIYVQNGYVISRNQGEELDAAYNNAALILAISDDTEECIKLAYPACADRLHRVHYSVNPDKFVARAHKENIICYMPRKLARHSQLVTFFLGRKIPPHWRIKSIDGLDENGVADILGKSRIFLSFSEFEGCPLPPVEAGLSGCHVIGYTGEGAKEYWDPEIFTEIYSGDIKTFVKAVLNKIDVIDSSPSFTHVEAVNRLANRYSAQVELADMQLVSKKIVAILDRDY